MMTDLTLAGGTPDRSFQVPILCGCHESREKSKAHLVYFAASLLFKYIFAGGPMTCMKAAVHET